MDTGSKSDIFTGQGRGDFFKKIGLKSKVFVVVIILLLLGGSGYVFFKKETAQEIENPQVVTSPQEEAGSKKTVTSAPGEPELVPLFGDANYQSENFRVGEVAIGGEAEFLLSEDSPDPVAISSIRGESFTEKNKKEVKLVVSWKTNKLAKSEISYSKGVGQPSKEIGEDDYSLNHSVIISGLDQASTYVYKIKSDDRFGNQAESDPYAVYTGSRTVSLFDLIADAVSEVFGWAVSSR